MLSASTLNKRSAFITVTSLPFHISFSRYENDSAKRLCLLESITSYDGYRSMCMHEISKNIQFTIINDTSTKFSHTPVHKLTNEEAPQRNCVAETL